MTLRNLSVLYAALLMLSMAGALMGYRYFVDIPNIKLSIDNFHQRELMTLNRALKKEIHFLQTINYDYSVWDDSYEFVNDLNPEFIRSNLIDDTFTSLKIDGIYYYDMHYNMVWGRGYDHLNRESIGFTELNLQKNPALRTIYPNKKNSLGIPQNGGFIATRQGPVMFSSTELRRSDRSGNPVGVLIFVRRVRPGLIKSLEDLSQLNLSTHKVIDPNKVAHIARLTEGLNGESYRFTRQRLIEGPDGKPIMRLTIQHQQTEDPMVFDKAITLTLALLMLLPLCVLAFVDRYLIKPVTHSATVIRQMIKSQRFNYIEANIKITEFDNLAEDFNRLITTVNDQKATLEKLTLTDPLSKVANRRAFEQFIASSWSRMQRNQQPIAMLMCDIDYFKRYNDHYGHQAGDKAIIRVAQTLHQKINRSSDIVARYGGEEFALVLADSSEENCNAVVKMVLDTVRQLNLPHQHSLIAPNLTVSVGAALTTHIDQVPLPCHYEQLIAAADHALYQAKNAGRNRAVKVHFNAQSNETEGKVEVV